MVMAIQGRSGLNRQRTPVRYRESRFPVLSRHHACPRVHDRPLKFLSAFVHQHALRLLRCRQTEIEHQIQPQSGL